jgi:hypothetical protein
LHLPLALAPDDPAVAGLPVPGPVYNAANQPVSGGLPPPPNAATVIYGPPPVPTDDSSSRLVSSAPSWKSGHEFHQHPNNVIMGLTGTQPTDPAVPTPAVPPIIGKPRLRPARLAIAVEARIPVWKHQFFAHTTDADGNDVKSRGGPSTGPWPRIGRD